MSFIKKVENAVPFKDAVFLIAAKAKSAKAVYGADKVINATLGTLYGEDGKIVAYNTVYDDYNKIDNRNKAKYPDALSGNSDYKKCVFDWVFQDKITSLQSSVTATPGGTGALYLAIKSTLDEGQIILTPSIAWSSYTLMAKENHLVDVKYNMFVDDHFDLTGLEKVCNEVMDKQKKILMILNDPLQNPTGYSLSYEEWEQLIALLNKLSKKGDVVLINDIAYIDYSYNLADSRKYMSLFNTITSKVCILVTFSGSKTMTSYGLRYGACIVLAKKRQDVASITNLFEKAGRATWSCINNSAMVNFVNIMSHHQDEFIQEKSTYIAMLKNRSDIFKAEAHEVGLAIYPYKEGFFITIKTPNNAFRDIYQKLLMDNLIFTTATNCGIRVAICGLSSAKCTGLAKKMKEIYDQVKE